MDLKVGFVVVKKNKRSLEIKGIMPSFYNDGTTDCKFLERTLKPGEEIHLDFGDHRVVDSFDINFIPSSKPSDDKNRLVIHIGNPIKCNE